MWFIIIFGSIPVLRPIFIRFAQSIRTAAEQSRQRSNHPPYLTTSADSKSTWVQLDGKTQASATHNSARSPASHSSQREGSEEEILPVATPGQKSANQNLAGKSFFISKANQRKIYAPKTGITEASGNLVPDNYGSTETTVESLPAKGTSVEKRQDRQGGNMNEGIQVKREYAIDYED